MIELPGGGFVVDTPGLRGFGLWDLEARAVAAGYRELSDIACKFRDCLHRGEPGCGVPEALDLGELDEERYESYLRLVDELLQGAEGRQTQRRR